MKPYKNEILQRLDSLAENDRIISLFEVAKSLGVSHIKVNDVYEIAHRFLRDHSNYKALRLIRHKYDSTFTTLHFVDREIEFEDEDEFLKETEHWNDLSFC